MSRPLGGGTLAETMRVTLADDQSSVRSALTLLLRQEADLEIVSEAADANELLAALAVTAPDLLLLDWELPGIPVNQLLRLLRCKLPLLKVIAMSSRPEAHQAALREDVYAFMSKSEPPARLLALIREAFRRREEDGTES